MKKYLFLFIGLIFMALGTSLCHLTRLGIDPANAFIAGVANQIGLGVGMTNLLFQGLLGLIVVLISRNLLGWGTLIPIVFFGYILQFFHFLFSRFVIEHSLANITLFIIGIVIIAFGMAIYMESDNGLVPYDCYAYILSRYFDKKPFLFRVGIDVLAALFAFILGGPINIGTIILAFGLGPIIDFFRKRLSNFAIFQK